MRKLVKEELNFTRSKDLKRNLGLDRRSMIDDWFETYAPNVEYTIDDEFNIKIEGDLYLGGSLVTELPVDLHIEGYLYLGDSKVAELPDNLHIGGNLYLEDSLITELPDNLQVDGKIYKDF